MTQLKERLAAVADRDAAEGRCVGLLMQVLGMVAYVEMRPSIAVDGGELDRLEQQVSQLEQIELRQYGKRASA